MSLETSEKAAIDFATRETKGVKSRRVGRRSRGIRVNQVPTAAELITVCGVTEKLYDAALVLGWEWVGNVHISEDMSRLISPGELLGRDYTFGVHVNQNHGESYPATNGNSDHSNLRGFYRYHEPKGFSSPYPSIAQSRRDRVIEEAERLWKSHLPKAK